MTASALDWVAALGTPMSITVGVVIGAGTFWRRPKLSIQNRPEEWRVERSQANEPIPSIRLAVRNGRLHRAAKGARVLVEGYRFPNGKGYVPLGSVPLGWTSAADQEAASVLLFPDAARTVDLGMFTSFGRQRQDGSFTDEWALAIAPGFAPFDARNVLLARPDGHLLRLIAGADDGRARRYDVFVNWEPEKKLVKNEWNSESLLQSVQVDVRKLH